MKEIIKQILKMESLGEKKEDLVIVLSDSYYLKLIEENKCDVITSIKGVDVKKIDYLSRLCEDIGISFYIFKKDYLKALEEYRKEHKIWQK